MKDSRTKLLNPLNSLYLTQFLSSFADNLNFFIIIGIVHNQGLSSVLGIGVILFAFVLYLNARVSKVKRAYTDRSMVNHTARSLF